MFFRNQLYSTISRFIAIVTILSFIILIVGCTRKSERSTIDKMDSECWRLTRNKTDFKRSDSLAGKLLEYGRRDGNRAVEAKALYYLGVYDGDPAHVEKRHKNLETCRDMLEPGRDDTLLLKVYNALGIYEVSHYRRYSQGIYYFTKSKDIARALGDEAKAMVAEQNLSAIMIFTGDTIGIKYDEDIYRYAEETGDTALLYRSASHCGFYYSHQKFDEKKARKFADIVKGTSCDVNYHKIMAYIAMHYKNWREAERRWLRVLEESPKDATSNMNYAELLNLMGRWQQSNRYAVKADSLYALSGCFGPAFETAGLMASNYASLGDMAEAYRWQKVYSERIDSLQKIKQQETVMSARIMFDTQKKEHTITLQAEKVKNLHTWIFSIFLIAVVAIAMMFIYTRKRNRRYKQIVERSRLAASQELALFEMLNKQETEIKNLREELARQETEAEVTPVIPADTLQETPSETKTEQYDRIFGLILREVIDRKGYRDPAITRDVLSKRVGCNHTYLSETIKKKTGLSYSKYMNSVRVNEAVRILTKGTEMTLEELSRYVGFLSTKTFYVAFKEFVGVPPGNFRDIVSKET